MAIQTLLKGMGLGAGLMYLWDPNSGRRRRARMMDQWDHAVHCTQDYLDKAQRDASNRAAGLSARTRSLMHRDEADDRVITARVRSKLGRYCSHPHAISVESRGGHVMVGGPCLEDEVGDVLKAACSVRGVRGVESRLEVHRQAGQVSALQGGAKPNRQQAFDFLEESWSPATRVAGQMAGAAMMGHCMTNRSLASSLIGVLGLGLFVRATTNRGLAQLAGAAPCPQPVRFQRTLTIHAPVEKVWDFLSDFEEVGRFLPAVRSVENLGGGHFRWGLNLPMGQELEIEERITECVPQERLCWESVATEPVSYCGTLTLQSEGDDSTRVDIRFDYTPPGGKLGAALAALFGVDAKGQFQEAVVRIKPFLETGQAPHDLHEVSSRNRLKDIEPRHRHSTSTGQPQWVQGEPQSQAQSPSPQPVSPQPPSLGQAAQVEPDQPPPSALPPNEIPPVHAKTQPAPHKPQGG